MTDEKNAYLISGTLRTGSERIDILGILFSPDPPSMKTLKAMRIEGMNASIDPVKCIGVRPADPCFYYFVRGSLSNPIQVAKLNPDGSFVNVGMASSTELQKLPSMSAPPSVLAKFMIPDVFVIRESVPPAPRQSNPSPEPREMGERRSSNPGQNGRQSHPPRQQR